MTQIIQNVADFGMDTITLAGPLEAKLAAMKAAGFSQVMLKANDINGHPGGIDAAVAAVKASGLRGTGFQVLRDFEGLSGHLHSYKIDIAKAMLEMCAALDCKVLLACSSTSAHATQDLDHIARDLRKLAAYFAERAEGEVGLMVTGGFAPNIEGWAKPFAGTLATSGAARRPRGCRRSCRARRE